MIEVNGLAANVLFLLGMTGGLRLRSSSLHRVATTEVCSE